MFLIDDIKPKGEKKFKTFFVFFCVTVYGKGVGSVQNETSFVSFRFRFVGGNKIFIQKIREIYL